MQREAPACLLPTLFEQNDVLRQAYTVTTGGQHTVQPGETLCAVLICGDGPPRFAVTNVDGRTVGFIGGESGRVLAEIFQQNHLTAARLIVTGITPVSGNAQVQILPE
jgi:hypothetical protein